MLDFIVLGLIPGTNIQLSFIDTLLAGTLAAGIYLLASSHYRELNQTSYAQGRLQRGLNMIRGSGQADESSR